MLEYFETDINIFQVQFLRSLRLYDHVKMFEFIFNNDLIF